MLRPTAVTLTPCARCGEPGIHATSDACIEALKRAIGEALKRATEAFRTTLHTEGGA